MTRKGQNDALGMKLHSSLYVSRPFHTEPLIFYEDGCAFSPPRSVSSTAFCLSPKYKSGRSSATMGGKTATTVATTVMTFIVSL